MRLEGVELVWLGFHLRTPMGTATGAHADRPVVALRVRTDEAEGFGECAALDSPTYSEEYAAGAWQVLQEHLVPELLRTFATGADKRPLHPTDVGPALAAVRGHAMAKAAVEMAVLDAFLRGRDESLSSYLGVRNTRIEAGAVVGTHDTVDDLLADVSGLVAVGYQRVRVKISPGWDLEPLRALRAAFPKLVLQADANGSYAGQAALSLRALDAFELTCLEQPFAAEDLLGHAALARELDTPICLDESLTSVDRLTEAITLGACEVACVKPARLGGYLPAVRALEHCMATGVPAWCGGMFETGFARAGNAAFAGLPGCSLPGDFTAGERFVEQDPAGPLVLDGGTVAVHAGSGVGPAPDRVLLAAVTQRSVRFAL
jgi:O-succinylbenzoate synthase